MDWRLLPCDGDEGIGGSIPWPFPRLSASQDAPLVSFQSTLDAFPFKALTFTQEEGGRELDPVVSQLYSDWLFEEGGANKKEEELSVGIEIRSPLTKMNQMRKPGAEARCVSREDLPLRVPTDNEVRKMDGEVKQTPGGHRHLEPPRHTPGGAWLTLLHECILGMTGIWEMGGGGVGSD
ncbi:hypothetical protein NDU88_005279 [Pleurodeles waltl]|uniref:Uncharacterized protein n=1 Tax=Pleurodeles waltl TaxID=8319 RepID=A0AAV7SLB9_PLEWA|nr:hypothetical protein NDU88_005279 [Pleurodeles waltl]